MAAGATIVFSPFRNPKTIQATPGDANWHQLANWPPAAPMEAGSFLITTTTSTLGAGSGCWIQFNSASAPSDTSKAWPVHGGGQVLTLGGGVSNIWYQLQASSDIFCLMYEG